MRPISLIRSHSLSTSRVLLGLFAVLLLIAPLPAAGSTGDGDAVAVDAAEADDAQVSEDIEVVTEEPADPAEAVEEPAVEEPAAEEPAAAVEPAEDAVEEPVADAPSSDDAGAAPSEPKASGASETVEQEPSRQSAPRSAVGPRHMAAGLAAVAGAAAAGEIKVNNTGDSTDQSNNPKALCTTFFVVGENLTPGPGTMTIYRGPSFTTVLYTDPVLIGLDGSFSEGPIAALTFNGQVKIEVTQTGGSIKSKVINVRCAPADVSMTKTNNSAAPGTAFNYTLTLSNSGQQAATNVDVSDPVPAAFDVTSVTTTSATGSCGFVDQQVECTGLTVPGETGGVDGVITITISVAAPGPQFCGQTFVNTASSSAADDASDPGVTTPDCFSELTLAKDSGAPLPGDAFSYTITYTNTGYADAVGVSLSDTVPDEFAVLGVVTSSALPGFCGFVGQQVECEDLVVPARDPITDVDGVMTVTISVDAPDGADCGLLDIINTVTSDGGDNVNGALIATDTGVDTPACFSDLTLAKTNNAVIGAGFDYTITFTNSGYADATAVTLSDQVPDAFQFVAVSTNPVTGTCGESPVTPNLVECTGLTVPARDAVLGVDGVLTVTITVDAPTDADCGQTLINTVNSDGGSSISGPLTADDAPGVDTPACVFPTPDPSIAVVKTADVGSADVGETITYTYVITNTGDVTLTDLSVFDDVIGVILSDTAGASLAPGDSMTVTSTYKATEDDGIDGSVTNVATATGRPPTGDPVTGKDTVTVPVGVTFVEDTAPLTVVKQVSGTHSGAAYEFTVDCGVISVGKDAAFSIPAIGGSHEVGVALPVGTSCRVVETGRGGATSTTVAVNEGAASSGVSAITSIRPQGSTVTFTNAFADAPVDPPQQPPAPELPATGADVALQLSVAIAALMLGGTLVRGVRPRKPDGWLRA